jgi:PAS domain S-box-containing protein
VIAPGIAGIATWVGRYAKLLQTASGSAPNEVLRSAAELGSELAEAGATLSDLAAGHMSALEELARQGTRPAQQTIRAATPVFCQFLSGYEQVRNGRTASPMTAPSTEGPASSGHRARLEELIARRTAELAVANQRLEQELAERKRAEAAQRESEASYRQIFATVSDAIMVFDAQTRQFLDVNQAAARLYGYSREEFLRLRHPDITAEPEESDASIAMTLAGKLTRIPLRYHRKKDGTVFPAEISASALTVDGRPALCGVVRDVTDRKRMEDLLRSQRDLALALSSTGDLTETLDRVLEVARRAEAADCGCIYLVDQATGNLNLVVHQGLTPAFVERTACLAGHTPEAREILAGKPIYGAHPGISPAALENLRAEGVRGLAVIPVQYQGQVVASLHLGSRTRDELHPSARHTLEAMAAHIGGALARLSATAALSESERLFRTLAETAPVGIFIGGQTDRLHYVNAEVSRILGYSTEEALQRHFLEFVHPDMRELVAERAAARMAGRPVPSRYEMRVVRKDGRELWLDFSAAMIEYQGQPAVLGVALDITDRKRAEEAARQHRDQLAHAARLSIIGETASGLAHELAQPLSAILYYARGGATRLSAGTWGPAEAADAMRKIAAQAERAGEFIRRMKTFVRLGQPTQVRSDLNQIVHEALSLAALEGRKSQVVVRLALGPSLPAVVVDPIQIEQVILNLIRNGIEAMDQTPSGQRELLVSTYADPDQNVCPSVRDTGRGLSDRVAAQMFDPFFTTKPAGIGLGLSISRTIIEETHGGKLWFERPPARGTVVGFTLPAVKWGQS